MRIVNDDTVEQFMKLVGQYTYDESPRLVSRALTNFTFWAGAGFSRSWGHNAPVGSELYKLKTKSIEESDDTLRDILASGDGELV